MQINKKDVIYLDNNATTRTDPLVVEAMLPFFTAKYGNPASTSHVIGWEAEDAVSEATQNISNLINAEPFEIIFTSGATESNNLAIKGLPFSEKDHIIVSNIEHKCVLETAKFLKKEKNVQLSIVECDSFGQIKVDEIKKYIKDNTKFVSIMIANNEIHTINPIKEISRVCKERGIMFHVDAAQAIGKIKIDVKNLGVDMLSLSSHKFYGPKGIGILYIKNGINDITLNPLLHGGKQEKGLRSGTLAVPLIVGLGFASKISKNIFDNEETELVRIKELTKKMFLGLKNNINEIKLNGVDLEDRLPGGLSLTFPYIDIGQLQFEVPHICFSRSSACSSGHLDYSYVLKAIGITPEQAVGTGRFCVGRFTTEEDIQETIFSLSSAYKKLYRKRDFRHLMF